MQELRLAIVKAGFAARRSAAAKEGVHNYPELVFLTCSRMSTLAVLRCRLTGGKKDEESYVSCKRGHDTDLP